MKKTILLFAALVSFTVAAQEDPCKEIKMITIKSGPAYYAGAGGVEVKKIKVGEGAVYYLMVRRAQEPSDPVLKGVSVTLDNGTRIERKDLVPHVRLNDSGLTSIREYSFDLTMEELKWLIDHKIVSSFAHDRSIDITIFSDKIKAYLDCLIEIKIP